MTLRTPAIVFTLLLFALGCEEESTETPSEHSTEAEEEEETTEATQAETEAAPVHIDDPSTCVPCHDVIVEEWTASMHSQAHHSADPLYAAMRDFRVAREGESLREKCAGCHGPRAVDELEGPVAHTGVSCATCHNLSDVTEGRGVHALHFASDDTLRGPRDEESSAHTLGPGAPFLADGRTICVACHGSLANAQGAATCTTGDEFATLAGNETCTHCHMPEAPGPGAPNEHASHRAHVFIGPHSLWNDTPEDDGFMATAVTVSGELDAGSLQATLVNQTGHAMPTGFPGRMMLVKVTGFDAQGEQIFTNFTDDPMHQDPAAVFNKIYVNADGEVVMPPYGATIRRDTRLTPGETRTLAWELPTGVIRAEVTLLFRLLPPPAAQAMNIQTLPESSPRPFSTTTLVVSSEPVVND